MKTITNTVAIVTLGMAFLVGAVVFTASTADAGPSKFGGTKSVSGLDLGSGR